VSRKSEESERDASDDHEMIATAIRRMLGSIVTHDVRHIDVLRLVEAALEQGRRAWPALSVSPAAFVAQAMGNLRGEEDIVRALSSLRAEDTYLASACASGIPAALLAFEAAYFDEIPRLVAATVSDADLGEDIRQSLREKLFAARGSLAPEIAKYAGRGSLLNWFRIAAVHHVINLKRKERRAASAASPSEKLPHDGEPDFAEGVAIDPEILYLREKYSHEFRTAVDIALAQLSPEDRPYLVYHYVERLTIDQVGTLHGVHRVTAARRINAARDRLVSAIRAALQARLRVGPTELESILRLLPRQLPLSLSRRLRASCSP